MATSRLFKSYLPDQEEDRAVGVMLPLNKDTYERVRTGKYIVPVVKNVGVFTQSYSTEEQAISNLVNLLLTRRGERPMNPRFGSPIPDYQFEQNSRSNLYKLETGVDEAIRFWLPYIDILNIKADYSNSYEEIPLNNVENTVAISISFRITKAGANRTITVYTNGIDVPIYNIQ